MINKERRKIQEEALKAFKDRDYNGFAKIPTGTGKAWVLIQIIKELKPKTCWYLCDSTKNRDVTFKKELKKWEACEWINKIEFMCYQTAYKLKNFKVDLVLADESDYALTEKYSEVFRNNSFKHRVLVSGTISNEKFSTLNDLNIPFIFNIELNEAEDRGALNKANYYIVNYLLNKKENFKYLKYNRTFARVLNRPHSRKEVEMLQINRKHFLSNLDSSLNVCRKLMKYLYEQNRNNKILIFCGLSEQADRVCKYSFHSKTDDSSFKKFDDGDIRLLSVVSKADRGLNIKGVNTIIFESPSKSSTKFFQRTGRGRRLHINDELNVYFLVPHYIDTFGKTKPTVVYTWVLKSAAKLDNFEIKNFKF